MKIILLIYYFTMNIANMNNIRYLNQYIKKMQCLKTSIKIFNNNDHYDGKYKMSVTGVKSDISELILFKIIKKMYKNNKMYYIRFDKDINFDEIDLLSLLNTDNKISFVINQC